MHTAPPSKPPPRQSSWSRQSIRCGFAFMGAVFMAILLGRLCAQDAAPRGIDQEPVAEGAERQHWK
jgi:hypothetical protein